MQQHYSAEVTSVVLMLARSWSCPCLSDGALSVALKATGMSVAVSCTKPRRLVSTDQFIHIH